MRGPSPVPEQIERFRRDAEALCGGAPAKLGAAVSGGPDSFALLLLAAAAWPERVCAATVDHGLRPESRQEAALVAHVCASLGIPHAILAGDASPEGNIQSAARAMRYRLLGAWAEKEKIGWIATGHHVDDQAETLLMRLLRGSGLPGLAAIRPASPLPGESGEVRLVRPLLGWRRAELAAIVAAAGIAAVADPSNSDPRYDRSRIRSLLAGAPWIDPEPLARSSGALAEAEEALAWTAERLARERIRRDGPVLTLDSRDLPPELRRRLALEALRRLGAEAPPRGDALQRLLRALERGETASLAGVMCSGGAVWRFAAAPPRRI